MTANTPIVVQKFGGSSVASGEKIRQVARLIQKRASKGDRLCVVVSAMGKTTDQLLAQAHEVSKNPSRRELDMLLSCGERASMALLAMALEDLGCSAVSLTGSQSGIITSDVHSGAKILELRPERVMSELDKGRVVIVAGFQGISIHKEITTLGRGGSDTTAVALAAALGALACEIYSDVPGVMSADPKIVKDAVRIPEIGAAAMEELSLFGAKVMHAQALQYAKERGVKIRALKTEEMPKTGTLISPQHAEAKMSQVLLTCKDPIYHLRVFDNIGLELLLAELSQNEISHIQITGGEVEKSPQWDVFVHPEDAHGLKAWVAQLSFVEQLPDCATVSMVGLASCEIPKMTYRALRLLRENKIEVNGISTAPNRTTFFLGSGEAANALRLLHAAGSQEQGLEPVCESPKSGAEKSA